MFEKIGNLFLIKPGSPINPEELEFYKDLKFNKFILFKEHFSEEGFPEKLRDLSGIFAVDQEGGRVCRIPGDFPSPLEACRLWQKDKELFTDWAKSIAQSLLDYGIRINLAPCVDLADENAPEFLRTRTFSKDKDLVITLAKTFIKVHREKGIFTCIKHFPGLKDVTVDPHVKLPKKDRPDEESLEVFAEILEEENTFVMTTHLVVEKFDKLPVTFSEKWIRFLREKIGYRGIVFTDDLEMGGAKIFELEEAILRGFASGHDVVIFCGDWERLCKAIFEIKSEIEKSRVIKENLSLSLERIWKYNLGML